MCYKLAKYFLCGHKASVNVMYCDHAKYSGSVCHKPPLRPIPSQPVHTFCPDCAANQHVKTTPVPMR